MANARIALLTGLASAVFGVTLAVADAGPGPTSDDLLTAPGAPPPRRGARRFTRPTAPVATART